MADYLCSSNESTEYRSIEVVSSTRSCLPRSGLTMKNARRKISPKKRHRDSLNEFPMDPTVRLFVANHHDETLRSMHWVCSHVNN